MELKFESLQDNTNVPNDQATTEATNDDTVQIESNLAEGVQDSKPEVQEAPKQESIVKQEAPTAESPKTEQVSTVPPKQVVQRKLAEGVEVSTEPLPKTEQPTEPVQQVVQRKLAEGVQPTPKRRVRRYEVATNQQRKPRYPGGVDPDNASNVDWTTVAMFGVTLAPHFFRMLSSAK